MYDFKVIRDILDNDEKVFFFPKYERYIVPINYTLPNPSNHIYQLTIEGRDITDMILNFGSNFNNPQTFLTNLTRERIVKFIYPIGEEYIYFS